VLVAGSHGHLGLYKFDGENLSSATLDFEDKYSSLSSIDVSIDEKYAIASLKSQNGANVIQLFSLKENEIVKLGKWKSPIQAKFNDVNFGLMLDGRYLIVAPTQKAPFKIFYFTVDDDMQLRCLGSKEASYNWSYQVIGKITENRKGKKTALAFTGGKSCKLSIL
jgi:hypothetical protein